MVDITLAWSPQYSYADFNFINSDLESDEDLVTAVIVSLYTDKIASVDFTPTDGTTDRRGWWGDTYEGNPIGSRLWQLERAKKNGETQILLKAREYCKEALQWLIDDGVAASVAVTTNWTSATSIGIKIVIAEPTVSKKRTFNFAWAWNQQLTLPILQPTNQVITPSQVDLYGRLGINFLLSGTLLGDPNAPNDELDHFRLDKSKLS